MADLPYIQEAQEVKITGQDSVGTTVNYVGADANGNLAVKDYADGPVSPGTVASVSNLIGGQYNTTLPTLTNTQQAAIQLDSSGRQIVTAGSGVNLDTQGSPETATIAGQTFFATTNMLSAGSTSETPYFTITNPNGSGKSVSIRRIWFGQSSVNSAEYRMYINPIITAAGTTITPHGGRQTGQNSAVATYHTLPTVSSNGSLFRVINTEASSSSGIMDIFDYSFMLDPNNILLITVVQGTSIAKSLVSVEVKEQ